MRTAFLFRYSHRNLWRNPRRTWLMLLSLSFGVAFILLIMNFSDSGINETRKEFLKHFTGEYTLTHPAYFDQKNLSKFNKYKTVSDEDFPPDLLKMTAPRVLSKLYASTEKKTLGILMVGMDPVQEKGLSTIHHSLADGKFLSDSSNHELVLGAKIARMIGAKVGDEISIIGQANDGTTIGENFKLVGTLDLGGGDLEAVLALTNIKDAQQILVMDHRYHERISFDMKRPVVNSTVKVTTWEELLPEVASSMRFSTGFLKLISILVTFLVCVSLANNFMITFIQREKEFKTLQIIGTNSLWITTGLFIEGILLVSMGLIMGLLLGSLLTYYFNLHPIDMQFLNGGQPLLLGGMKIEPKVRVSAYADPYWIIPLQVFLIFGVAMIHPLLKVIKQNRNRLLQP